MLSKFKDSVVVVMTLDTQGKVIAWGSGVLLPSGRIATNCQVVKGGASYRVGCGAQIAGATIFAEDGEKDICLLEVGDIGGKPAQIGKSETLKAGGPVYAVGAKMVIELSVSD